LAALIPSSARVATRSTQNQPSSHPALKTAKPQGPSNDPLLSPKAHAETRKNKQADRRKSIDPSTLTDATLAAPDLSKNKRLDSASLFRVPARRRTSLHRFRGCISSRRRVQPPCGRVVKIRLGSSNGDSEPASATARR